MVQSNFSQLLSNAIRQLEILTKNFLCRRTYFPSVFVAKRSTEAILSSVAFDTLLYANTPTPTAAATTPKAIATYHKTAVNIPKTAPVTLVAAVATPIAIAKEPIPETTIPIAPLLLQ